MKGILVYEIPSYIGFDCTRQRCLCIKFAYLSDNESLLLRFELLNYFDSFILICMRFYNYLVLVDTLFLQS